MIEGREGYWQKTNDGRTFETFPSLPEAEGVLCLETLHNGGDIFAMEHIQDEYENRVYIFRTDSSTWERQPDMPDAEYGIVACGPIRPDIRSSVAEIVVLTYYFFEELPYIFNIASSSWRAGEFVMHLGALMTVE